VLGVGGTSKVPLLKDITLEVGDLGYANLEILSYLSYSNLFLSILISFCLSYFRKL